VLITPPSQELAEGSTLQVTNQVVDPSALGRTLRFKLVAGPTGMSVDEESGVMVWTPSEDQGPSTNRVVVGVEEEGAPPRSATNEFTVVVTEVNRAPSLVQPPNCLVHAGTTLIVTNRATDADWPTNTLEFSLISAPAGMAIDARDGTITWQPTTAQASSTNVVSVSVSDNGVPALSDTRIFEVVVLPAAVAPKLEGRLTAGGSAFALSWTFDPEVEYQVEFKRKLSDPDWLPAAGTVQIAGQTATFMDQRTDSQRYYRLHQKSQ
jgi:hypothetical protein